MELIPAISRPVVEWGMGAELLHGDHTRQLLAGPNQKFSAHIYVKLQGGALGCKNDVAFAAARRIANRPAIVGRNITASKDPGETARQCVEAALK
jgi:3-keto-L-gulonate-6-phosphate decarboxylase